MYSIAILAQASFHFPVKFLWPFMLYRVKSPMYQQFVEEWQPKPDPEIDKWLAHFQELQKDDERLKKAKQRLAIGEKAFAYGVRKAVEERAEAVRLRALDMNRMD
jgi:hypothetical protein